MTTIYALTHKTSLDNLADIIDQKALLTHQEQMIINGTVTSKNIRSLQSRVNLSEYGLRRFGGLIPRTIALEGDRFEEKAVVSSVYMGLYTKQIISEPEDSFGDVTIFFPPSLLTERKDWHATEYNNFGNVMIFASDPRFNVFVDKDSEIGYDHRSYPQFIQKVQQDEHFEVCFHSFVPLQDAMCIFVHDRSDVKAIGNHLSEVGLAIPVISAKGRRVQSFNPTRELSWLGVRPISQKITALPIPAWRNEHYMSSLYSARMFKRRM